jgi:phosphoglycerate kinase
MNVSNESMLAWCRNLLGANSGAPRKTLEQYLGEVPRLDSLSDLPKGTAVLVRGDVDAKPGAEIGQGDQRLRSMVDTLRFGMERGWKQVIFGHIGRKPEGSLKAVAARIGQLLNTNVPLVSDWLDEEAIVIRPQAAAAVADYPAGGVIVLENSRRYAIERALWDATTDDLPELAPKLAKLANELSAKIARAYVNEALSAGSLDGSSTIVPAAMDRVALGRYVASEFDGPMRRCLKTQLVVFSGLKIDKLDDLQAMIDRGTIRWVFAAGSLAMALKKAAGQLDGAEVNLGLAEDATQSDKPFYIGPERIEQARRMISAGREKGIQFVLPVDFVLGDGRVSKTIGPGEQQFDVGPDTIALFERKVGEFIESVRPQLGTASPPVAFHNGVFGMFEDPRFENGTRRFIGQLKRMKEVGVEVYVGGGEGGTALEKYGKPDWVTHCFTAGGTVLNALGSAPVSYLQALSMAANRR